MVGEPAIGIGHDINNNINTPGDIHSLVGNKMSICSALLETDLYTGASVCVLAALLLGDRHNLMLITRSHTHARARARARQKRKHSRSRNGRKRRYLLSRLGRAIRLSILVLPSVRCHLAMPRVHHTLISI